MKQIQTTRILGKIVGQEISAAELEMIAGGVMDASVDCSKDKVTTGVINGPDKCDTPIK